MYFLIAGAAWILPGLLDHVADAAGVAHGPDVVERGARCVARQDLDLDVRRTGSRSRGAA